MANAYQNQHECCGVFVKWGWGVWNFYFTVGSHCGKTPENISYIFILYQNTDPDLKECMDIFFLFFFVGGGGGGVYGLNLNVPVNSYGHVRTVSSPNHTFFLSKLDKAIYLYLPCSWQAFLNQRKGGEWPKKLFHEQSQWKYGTGPGSNLQPLDLQLDTYLQSDILVSAVRHIIDCAMRPN